MIIDVPLGAVIVLFTVVVCAFMYMLGKIIKCQKRECSRNFHQDVVDIVADDMSRGRSIARATEQVIRRTSKKCQTNT